MIVTCPACSARYKVDEAKIHGRGAKITCPKCKQPFVVYKGEAGAGEEPEAPPEAPAAAEPAPAPAPAQEPPTVPRPMARPVPKREPEILRKDFRRWDITWRVRNDVGVTYEFHDLATLREYLDDGQVAPRDALSWDGRTWVPMDSLPDLERHFEELWERASRGQLVPAAPAGAAEEEGEDDAPTTIVDREASLADAIRQAVKVAKTPPAPPPREEPERPAAAPAPPPARPSPVRPAPSGPAPAAPPRRSGGSSLLVVAVVSVVLVLLLAAVALVAFGVLPGDDAPTPAPTELAPAEPAPAEPAPGGQP